MRLILPLLLGSPAGAHTGHVADVGGHDHWGLAIGLGVIAGAVAVGWVKGRRAKACEDRDAEPEAEASEGEGRTA